MTFDTTTHLAEQYSQRLTELRKCKDAARALDYRVTVRILQQQIDFYQQRLSILGEQS